MTKIIVQNPTPPSLLITPDESRDRNGPVALTESGAVRRVPFDGGQAFFVEEGTTNLVPNPSFEIDLSGWGISGGAVPVVLTRDTTQSTDGTASLRVDVDGEWYRQGATNQVEISPATTYTLSAFVKAPVGLGLDLGGQLFNGGTYIGDFPAKAFVGTGSWERVVNTQTTRSLTIDTLRAFVRIPSSGYPATSFWVDGVQVEQKPYATPYADGDMGTGYSWTGTPHNSASVREGASISAPLDTFTTAYIRHDGGSSVLTESGTFGDHGLLTLDNGTLTVSTDRETTIAAVVLYDTTLTGAEISRLDSIPTSDLTWANMILTERTTPAEIEVAVPKGKSGLYSIETKVHQSDMFGTVGREIPVTNAGITSDIDRAGSKTRVDLETVYLNPENQYTIGPGRWVTVFQEISREGMGTERVQRGVFELGQPTVRIKGQRDNVHNSGNDVVDRLARASVLDTFYTPPRGHVMSDIHLAIRMLGITSMGPNLVENGGFEDSGSGWIVSGGANGTISYSTSVPAEGLLNAAFFVNSGVTAGNFLRLYRDVPIPPGTQYVMVSGISWRNHIPHRPGVILDWRTSDLTGIGNSPTLFGGQRIGQWSRTMTVVPVRDGAAYLRIIPGITTTATTTAASISRWDDIQVRPCTGDLLPESVLALPENSTQASSRIQHLPGDTLLAAVNDRLSAIGMMAVHATPDGKFTSRPGRDVASDAPVRTFHMDEDMQMIGDVTMQRSVTSMYNRVFAIKEDFTTGTSMAAVAENDDPSDQWSIHNILLEPKIVQVQDAANMEVLQEVADTELARASVQLSIKFAILPDPALTVYDIIEIVGPSQRGAVGKWAIESIESGLTTDNPLMIIGARRSTR